MKEKACFFIGFRTTHLEAVGSMLVRLNDEVDKLTNAGVTDFICGGAMGFEQIAAGLIVAKKEMGKPVRLVFALPYRRQHEFWSDAQKELYHNLLDQADETIYVSDEYYDGCIEACCRYMVDRSTHCICALSCPCGGIGEVVGYASERGVNVVNVGV